MANFGLFVTRNSSGPVGLERFQGLLHALVQQRVPDPVGVVAGAETALHPIQLGLRQVVLQVLTMVRIPAL